MQPGVRWAIDCTKTGGKVPVLNLAALALHSVEMEGGRLHVRRQAPTALLPMGVSAEKLHTGFEVIALFSQYCHAVRHERDFMVGPTDCAGLLWQAAWSPSRLGVGSGLEPRFAG